MTTFNRDHNQKQGRCSKCDHDLVAAGSKAPKEMRGKVYCSNEKCKHSRAAHKTGPSVNQGKLMAA